MHNNDIVTFTGYANCFFLPWVFFGPPWKFEQPLDAADKEQVC